MNTIDKIFDLMAQHDISAYRLSKDIGLTNGLMTQWKNGRQKPSLDSLNLIADYFDVSPNYLLGKEDSPKGIKIPVLSNVQAGLPIEAIQDIIDYEEISIEMASQGEHFALMVRGDSMEPKFSQGDVVIVRQQPDVDNGDIAIVLIDGESATIKKIQKHKNGITLIPTNVNYSPVFYDNEKCEALPVTILGKVIELRAKF